MGLLVREYGGFQTWWYPQIIYVNRIFHEINQPFWGTFILRNPHIRTAIKRHASGVPCRYINGYRNDHL
jgi:hypothetical protein